MPAKPKWKTLNGDGVRCPAEVDAARNAHRGRWTWRTVACILANPRYTGRQVWNRYGIEHQHPATVRRPNHAGEWLISARAAHPGLVTVEDFVAAQSIRAARKAGDGMVRAFVLAELVWCGVCGRRMETHWVNGRSCCRCRHGHSRWCSWGT